MKIRSVSIVLVVAAVVAGTLSDRSRPNPPVMLGGYRVLSADFHVHSFPLSWSLLGPADTVLEARRQNLDVIAMTGHNHVWVAKVGRWFSRLSAGPTVLIGEEIVNPHYHLLAIGIDRTVDWRQTSASAIEEIHKQGGIAIAAHPIASYSAGYSEEAVAKLDGAEVLHPIAYSSPEAALELRQFFSRGQLAAIGDSDYHGLTAMGVCRTFVFAQNDSESAILAALRARHTVVYDRYGRAFGDPQLISLSRSDPRFRPLLDPPSKPGPLSKAGSAAGLLGLLGIFLFNPKRESAVRNP